MNRFEIASTKDIDEIIEDAKNLPFLCNDNETLLNRTGYYTVLDTKMGDSVAVDVSKGTNENTQKPNFVVHVDVMGRFEDNAKECWFTTKGQGRKELSKIIERIIRMYAVNMEM